MPEGTIACLTLELAVLSSEQSRRGLFGAQQIAAPPSIGDFYDAATSALMVALEDNTVPFCGRSKFRLERLEGQYCRFPYRNTFED